MMISPRSVCAACKCDKPTSDFSPDRRKKNGIYSSCKACSRLVARRWYRKNKERASEQSKRSRKRNAANIAKHTRLYREKNKDRIRVRMKDWKASNRQHVSEYSRIYNKANRTKLSEYVKEKAKNDIQYRLSRQLRSRFADAVRGRQHSASAVSNLGCPIAEFKTYLSSLWLPGMSWKNWGRGPGKWHIDHVRPLSSFDLTNPDQQKIACHYTNLQPLWEKDNLRKNGPRRKKSLNTPPRIESP